jgi:hypothetical protein
VKRGLIDRITNRDVVSEQRGHIDFLTREMREKNELIDIQAEAIDEFRGEMVKLSEEISELWDTVNKSARRKGDESEKDKSG